MNLKIVFVFLFALCLPITISAQSNQKRVKDTIPAFIGVSYIPALNWKVFNITKNDGNYLKYKFDLNSQSSFEGNFGIRRIGLRLGISANVENNLVGKAYRYGGYLGFKNFWLRVQTSKVSGTAYWSGSNPDPSIYPNKYSFTNEYFTVELLKTSNAYKHMAGGAEVNRILGTYWGIGYTSMAFPLKISTLVTTGGRENQKFGIPAYDTLFKAKYYTACFGFDILRQLCLTGGKYGAIPGRPAAKFGIYALTQDKVGFGPGEHSEFVVKMAEALNPGKKFVNPKGISVLVHYTLSAGFRYALSLRPVFLIAAIGYDFEGASIVNFGGAADTSTDLGYESSFDYFNHGISFKVYLSWIGNK